MSEKETAIEKTVSLAEIDDAIIKAANKNMSKTQFKADLDNLIGGAKILEQKIDSVLMGNRGLPSELEDVNVQLVTAWFALKQARRSFSQIDDYFKDNFSL